MKELHQSLLFSYCHLPFYLFCILPKFVYSLANGVHGLSLKNLHSLFTFDHNLCCPRFNPYVSLLPYISAE